MKINLPRYIFVVSILVILFGKVSSIYSQTSSIYGREPDSLMTLIKMDKTDTTKVYHLGQLAWFIMYQNPDTAIELCNQALELGKQIVATNDPKTLRTAENNMALANNNIGFTYYIKGEYKTALLYHFKALEIRERYQNKKGLMASYNNIGVVYRDQGYYPKALEYFFMALRFAKELDNKNAEATILNNIGNIYHSEKDYLNAIKAYTTGLTMSEAMGNKNLSGNLMLNMGSSYLGQNKYKEALNWFFKALELNQEVDNKYATASTMLSIANVYNVMLELDKALEWYEKSLVINKEIDNKNGISASLGAIGINCLHRKKYKEAESNLLAALKISEELGALDLVLNQSEGLSEMYVGMNNYKLAYEYHVKYLTTKDSLFNDEKSKEIGKLEARHELEIVELERIKKAEEDLKIKTQKRERKNLLQYSGITVLLLIFALLIVLLGFKKVSPVVASGVTFFAFLLFFEFLLVLLDPTMDRLSGGEPAYKLLFNAGVAALIFPFHAFFERLLKKKLIKK